ncbi:MAG: hypothetical protein WCF65_08230 [Parachlamydiaceae bacterium]
MITSTAQKQLEESANASEGTQRIPVLTRIRKRAAATIPDFESSNTAKEDKVAQQWMSEHSIGIMTKQMKSIAPNASQKNPYEAEIVASTMGIAIRIIQGIAYREIPKDYMYDDPLCYYSDFHFLAPVPFLAKIIDPCGYIFTKELCRGAVACLVELLERHLIHEGELHKIFEDREVQRELPEVIQALDETIKQAKNPIAYLDELLASQRPIRAFNYITRLAVDKAPWHRAIWNKISHMLNGDEGALTLFNEYSKTSLFMFTDITEFLIENDKTGFSEKQLSQYEELVNFILLPESKEEQEALHSKFERFLGEGSYRASKGDRDFDDEEKKDLANKNVLRKSVMVQMKVTLLDGQDHLN